MDSIVSRMLAAYGVARKTFGVYVLPPFAAWVFLNIRIAVAVGMALDNVFFPALKTKKADRPIVLVGNPRTGTTFLQRYLADHGYGAGMQIWRMLYPSLTLQFFIKPILPLLEIVSPAKYHSTPAHKTSLSSVETDDVGVLFRYFDGFFLYGFFMSFAEEELKEQFDPNARGTNQRDFAWLDELWRRSLVAQEADRQIVKLFSLGPRTPEFLETYPDAHILYMARDPVAILPSAMSLVSGVLENAFQFSKLDPEIQKRWYKRMYGGLIDLLQRFTDDWNSGRIDRERVYIVRYDRMMAEFEVVMDEIHTFLEIEPTEAQKTAAEERGKKQRNYKSGHKYDLEKYHLDEDQIRKDCAFFYDTFLPPLETNDSEQSAS